MKLSDKIRNAWHDVFYKNATAKRYDFALKCQDVTAKIDFHQKPETLSSYFRIALHLSLCTACKRYYDLSRALSRAINKSPPIGDEHLARINKQLLEKYGKKK